MMMRQGGVLAPRPIWRLNDLLSGFASTNLEAGEAIAISGLAMDSRRIQPGWLFLACQGSQDHGLNYAVQARAKGAVAIAAEPHVTWGEVSMAALGDSLGLPVIPVPKLRYQASQMAGRFLGEPSAYLQILGVTGTHGKTSVTHYLSQALAEEIPCGLMSALGVGFPDDLEPAAQTTPDPVTLQEALAWLRERGARAVAMEVTPHALDQGRAAGVSFQQAIFTDFNQGHFDQQGDMVSRGLAKRGLFRVPGLEWAILNLDDPLAIEILADLAAGVKVGGYCLNAATELPKNCELWARLLDLVPTPGGMRLELETSSGAASLELGLIGRFNAANVLAVLIVLLSRGLNLDRASRALAKMRGVPGRLERFGGAGTPLVVVDHAHTPDALEQALLQLRGHVSGRLICVFGCGGGRDTGKRPLMGAVAERLADQVLLTDDNPRLEDGHSIIDQILGGMKQPARADVERRRGLAIRRAIATAGRDDLVLVAGKGHEITQDLGDRQVHFSDRAQVQQALVERMGSPFLVAAA